MYFDRNPLTEEIFEQHAELSVTKKFKRMVRTGGDDLLSRDWNC